MAILAVAAGDGGVEQTLGVARAVADPDNIDAEFGIIVRSDLKGTGLGRMLMEKLIRTQREHGTQRLVATVLEENRRMLALAKELGFVESRPGPRNGMHEIHLALQPVAGGAPGRRRKDA
jgi:acetyltransferase